MKKERIEYLHELKLISTEEQDSLLRKYKYLHTSQSTLSVLTLVSAIFALIVIVTFKVNYRTIAFISSEEIRSWVSAFFACFSICTYYFARKTLNDSESMSFAYIGIGMSAPLTIMFLLFLIGRIFAG